MHQRTRDLIEYGKLCGFSLQGTDGSEHYVLRHPNGERVRLASTPGDYGGDRYAKALMRRLSGVKPPKPNAGHYKKGLSRQNKRERATVRVDSMSRQIALLRGQHRELCERIEYCRVSEDRDGAAEAISQLLDIEAEFTTVGVQAPVRRFRVWQPHPST